MISMLHCVPTTQGQIIFRYHIFGSLYSLLSPLSFPLATAILLSVSMGFSFVSHIWVKSWFWASSDWLILLSVIFPRSVHVVTNRSISSFLWLSSLDCLFVCLLLNCMSSFIKNMFIYFRERGKERQRERDRARDRASTGCLPYTPQLGTETAT